MKNLLQSGLFIFGTVMFITSCSPNGPKNGDKEITAFSIVNPPAGGIIDTAAKTILAQVPRGTDLSALVATFTTTGAKVSVGSVEQTSGVTANNYNGPVAYTVTAEDNSTANYTVTVSAKKYCLFVSAIGDTGDPMDIPIMNKLRSWGYELKIVASTSLTSMTDSFALYDFAFLSETPNSSDYAPFRGHPLPMLNMEAFGCSKTNVLNWSRYPGAVDKYDPMPLVIAAGAPSELTGGLAPGTECNFVTATTSASEAQVGFIPTIQNIPIARFKSDTLVGNMVSRSLADSTAIAFTGGVLTAACAVEKGTTLADSLTIAQNRVVTIGIHARAFESITGEAYAMIRAGIEWILK